MVRQPPREAAAEEAIALYIANWFHRLVLHSGSPPPAPVSREQQQRQRKPGQAPVESARELQRAPTGLRHRRTLSNEATAAAFDGLEPLNVPVNGHRARLETILSGKDGLATSQPQPQPLPERRRPEVRRPGGRRRRGHGRSLSELEFEEVKGLQDLGFTLSEVEVDAELASIIPGLRRLRAEEEAKKAMAAASAQEEARRNTAARAASVSTSTPRRPYLSEAWEEEEEEVRKMLRNFRIPSSPPPRPPPHGRSTASSPCPCPVPCPSAPCSVSRSVPLRELALTPTLRTPLLRGIPTSSASPPTPSSPEPTWRRSGSRQARSGSASGSGDAWSASSSGAAATSGRLDDTSSRRRWSWSSWQPVTVTWRVCYG